MKSQGNNESKTCNKLNYSCLIIIKFRFENKTFCILQHTKNNSHTFFPKINPFLKFSLKMALQVQT